MKYIPYGRQMLDDDDIAAVCGVLKSDWLTTGPAVAEFEDAVCAISGARFGVAVSSGTAALHAALHAAGIEQGDEVIVPAMTFAATANAVLYCGGTPVFADVVSDTLLLDPQSADKCITEKTKAIISVDYTGQPGYWDELRALADRRGIVLIADACHSIGASYKGRPVGTLADITCFSFHPVKHIATGEGGMSVTDNPEFAENMMVFRNHGITTTAHQREKSGGWFYEMTELGYNYRITDFQCALGVSQLRRLPQNLARRREIAALYDNIFSHSTINPLPRVADTEHAYHLYVVRHPKRDAIFAHLRENGIGANVHYIPVHLHPYYRENLNTHEGMCPATEEAYGEIITLPLWPGMSDDDARRVASVTLEY